MSGLRIPVIFYHRIARPAPDRPAPAVFIEPERLDAQLRFLRLLGFRSISAGEMVDHLLAGTRPPGRRIVVSFDDGHLDNLTVAAPILARHGFRATIFVTAGFIGKSIRFDYCADSAGEPIVNPDQIRELAAAGFDIASHGMTHTHFADLSADAARRELVESKAILEEIVGKPVDLFAFPYGSLTPASARLLEEAGYRAGFSTARGVVHQPRERWFLKRLPVLHDMPTWKLPWWFYVKDYRRAQAKLDAMIAASERAPA